MGNQRTGTQSRDTRQQILGVLLIQTIVMLVLSAALLLLMGDVLAYSALLGGLIYIVPNLFVALRSLPHRAGSRARKVLAELYIGQIWKMALSVAGFTATFVWVHPISPFSLFGSFILLQLLGMLLQVKLKNRFLKL
ncbi:ATP synthase subunit I [Marinobacterium sedimentorum]|uniref:ATP synthase subunit I n=1 Tax=Marinobacterium sedimentorum TaxID=2927804 RepID=UPI0020C5D611|nr:ATP synthase subunit I [Marinobacterium sedimentorum]MCP8688323.1 ATP synthase subunit I [Marinobacterium sedimentorum]